jgi:hypothetical protein
MLARRLTQESHRWQRTAIAEIERGIPASRFASLLSLASRHAPRGGLAPSAAEIAQAADALEGWNPERWTATETLRVSLILARADLAEPTFVADLEECFRFADQGELAALYRSLGHLPAGERFVWRAGEGCRTNMRPVFEAVACDTPYPARFFDESAWCQLVLKAIFIGAPLWRVHDLDRRLSPELARMALDFADERRSAGRRIPPELWLCLGRVGGGRAIRCLEREAASLDPTERRAAALGLARAGEQARLSQLLASESERAVVETMRAALEGHCGQSEFGALVEGR